MNGRDVDVSITSIHGLITVMLKGEIDAHSAPHLHQTLEQLLDPRMRIALDLSGIAFIDSRGLQVLLTQTTRFREGGGRFEIVNASPRVRRAIGYAGLLTAFDAGDQRATLEAS